jgi:hypothetical protein
MTGFRDRGVRRHSQHYIEHADRVKASQGVPLIRRSRGVVRYAGQSHQPAFSLTWLPVNPKRRSRDW